MPAECILYLIPDLLSRRWTSAISAETEAVGVPIGTRQKSVVVGEYLIHIEGTETIGFRTCYACRRCWQLRGFFVRHCCYDVAELW